MDINFEFWLTLIVLVMGAILLLHYITKLFQNISNRDIVGHRDNKEDASFFVRTSKEYFGVLLFVLVLRSFLFEPNMIPSGSMLPTLTQGDFVLVKKYAYGIRLPVVGTKVIDIEDPKRGDIAVFNSVESTPRLFIKRIVGLPGDNVSYDNGRWSVNGEQLSREKVYAEENPILKPYRNYIGGQPLEKRFIENLDGFNHYIWDSERQLQLSPRAPWDGKMITPFVQLPSNSTGDGSWQVTVPEGHYFVMGDNRLNSADSRVWGFLPDMNLKGKAFYLWMHKVPGKWYDFNLTFSRNKRLDQSL